MPQKFEKFPFDPSRWPFFYGYAIILVSMVGMVMSIPGQTMGVSAFTDHVIAALKISRVRLTTAYMIGTISSALLLPTAGRLYDRLGARIMAIASASTLGAVLVLLSFADTITAKLSSGLPATCAGLVPVAVMSLGFFLLRFSGQGVLTMTCRNVLMQWFEQHRGLANGIRGVVVALAFSASPRVLDNLIQGLTWQGTWRVLALVIGVAFSFFALLFLRDTPEGCGLLPDGGTGSRQKRPTKKPEVSRQYTLKEARRVYSFWVFIVSLAILALYYTAFTFHVASIFEEAGRSRQEAFAVFLPASIIAVSISFAAGWASDHVKLKYLLMLMLTGMIVSMLGLYCLNTRWGKFLVIGGNGLAMGHFGLLGAVTWPTFFGRRHLGEISGFNMAGMVFGSAVGPWLYGISLELTQTYRTGIAVCLVLTALALLNAFRADNPQVQEPYARQIC